MIVAKDLSMRYPGGKGVFDLNFSVGAGEVIGYLGPNGAGKTTTIRLLMGFLRPSTGTATIGGKSCFDQATEIHRILGFVPGEMAFPEEMSGQEYLELTGALRGKGGDCRRKELLERFELSPKGSIKRYSKGMKQKLGLVTAFMHDPQVLVLDEPTSGLDPLMQNRFIELLLEEKQRGKTMLISSHIFEEIEKTCDQVLIIKEGRLITRSSMTDLMQSRRRSFLLKTADGGATARLMEEAGFTVGMVSDDVTEVYVTGEQIDRFGKTLGSLTLLGLDARQQTLEDIFMHLYTREGQKS